MQTRQGWWHITKCLTIVTPCLNENVLHLFHYIFYCVHTFSQTKHAHKEEEGNEKIAGKVSD